MVHGVHRCIFAWACGSRGSSADCVNKRVPASLHGSEADDPSAFASQRHSQLALMAAATLAAGSDDQRWTTASQILTETASRIGAMEQVLQAKQGEIDQLRTYVAQIESRMPRDTRSTDGGHETNNELVSKSAMPEHLTSRAKFRQRSKKFKMLLTAKNKKIGQLLKYAEGEHNEIDHNGLDIMTGIGGVDALNEKLYNTLQIYTDDCVEASVIVGNVGHDNGAEAWRRLTTTFDPVTEHTNNHLMSRIHAPPKATVRTVLATIEAWERLLRTYEERTKKSALTESSKNAILLEMVPKEVADHLGLNEHVYDTYDKMKTLIRKWVLQNTPQPMEIGQIDGDEFNEDPHDLDAIAQGVKKKFGNPRVGGGSQTPGPGAPAGRFPFKCYNCGEQGHKSADCKKPCGNCGVAGHISRDCPKPKKSKGRGKGSGKNDGDKKKNMGSLEEETDENEIEDMGGLDIDLCPLEHADDLVDPWAYGQDPWTLARCGMCTEHYDMFSPLSTISDIDDDGSPCHGGGDCSGGGGHAGSHGNGETDRLSELVGQLAGMVKHGASRDEHDGGPATHHSQPTSPPPGLIQPSVLQPTDTLSMLVQRLAQQVHAHDGPNAAEVPVPDSDEDVADVGGPGHGARCNKHYARTICGDIWVPIKTAESGQTS